MAKNDWFEVDKEGLAKLLERRGGKSFVVSELLQNAWDEQSTRVEAILTPIENRAACKIVVTDDSPQGFRDLNHAFTLFAESYKKGNPEQRGRFDLGEKLVLACCEEASIVSTTGTVYFEKDGTRRNGRTCTDKGTRFEGVIRMTREEYADVRESVFKLIPPPHIKTTFNTEVIPSRTPITEFSAKLPTEEQDENGILRRRERETTIRVYEVQTGEVASIYEMGIPVVETNDKYHVDIQQKVPVNFERENVPPSYLQKVRTYVLNHTFDLLSGEEDANETWVRNALEDEAVDPSAIKKVVTERFGEDAVAYDPSDPEGSKIAMSQGRQVIFGGSFSSDAWTNIRRSNVLPPAGQVTPSPKPYSPDGEPLNLIPYDQWTNGMKLVADYARMLGKELMGAGICVLIAKESSWPFSATYGKDMTDQGRLVLNLGRLGHRFFNDFPNNILKVDRLFIHEYGHHYSLDHLSSEYHEALCVLGAKLKHLALTKPELFKLFMSVKTNNDAGSLDETPEKV